MTDLVTGEAVAIDIRVARLASRALALLIDLMVQGMALYLFIFVAALVEIGTNEAVAAGLVIIVVVLVLVGYPTAFETLSRGRSLGKLALGLRVVNDNGGPVRFRQALIRALAGFVEFWLLAGSPALLASLFNAQGKRLGDIFAGTLVIQDRQSTPAPLYPVAMMPPHLSGWAASLELSQLSDETALTARQYLSRFWELVPEVREEMGRRIADQVGECVSPPAPAGLRPEIYLSAVLAERRRRTERRLAEQQARRAAIARRSAHASGTNPAPAPAGTAPGQAPAMHTPAYAPGVPPGGPPTGGMPAVPAGGVPAMHTGAFPAGTGWHPPPGTTPGEYETAPGNARDRRPQFLPPGPPGPAGPPGAPGMPGAAGGPGGPGGPGAHGAYGGAATHGAAAPGPYVPHHPAPPGPGPWPAGPPAGPPTPYPQLPPPPAPPVPGGAPGAGPDSTWHDSGQHPAGPPPAVPAPPGPPAAGSPGGPGSAGPTPGGPPADDPAPDPANDTGGFAPPA